MINRNFDKFDKEYYSKDFNFTFDSSNGLTKVWGKNKQEDPLYAPFSLIADVEITTICTGVNGIPCHFCYKSNTYKGFNMSLKTFKHLINILPKELTQIAFGVDAKLEANPEWYDIFKYTRDNKIVPNVTVANISDETADKMASVCGAAAVSRYENKNYCYDSIKRLTDREMNQVNMHFMIAKETLKQAYETLDDVLNDSRLKKLNAIVFLSLKKKGRGVGYTQLSQEEYNDLMKYAFSKGISFGMDSCSGNKFLTYLDKINRKDLSVYCTPCESTRESSYFNVHGEFFPCSFIEGTKGWERGISIFDCKDYKDFWYNEKTIEFRNKLIKNCYNCPVFKV